VAKERPLAEYVVYVRAPGNKGLLGLVQAAIAQGLREDESFSMYFRDFGLQAVFTQPLEAIDTCQCCKSVRHGYIKL
jgi:hypothetical protein